MADDVYLLVTPLLMLGVLTLVRFIGCQVVFPLDTPPLLDAPENVTARPGNQRIDVSWDPVEHAESYVVKRGEAPGPPYPFSISLPVTQTTFGDSPLTNGVTEFYRVAGVLGNTEGTLSDEVSATPGLGLITSKTLGTLRNNFTGFVGMVVRVAGTPLTVVGIGRIFVPGNSGTHVVKIADGATGVDLPNASVTINLSAGGPANEFVYAVLPAPITLTPNTDFLVISQETSGGDQWYDLDTTVTTLPVASVLQGVFGDGVAPFVRGGAPGSTFGPVDLLT
jgi:hypothetical protein